MQLMYVENAHVRIISLSPHIANMHAGGCIGRAAFRKLSELRFKQFSADPFKSFILAKPP